MAQPLGRGYPGLRRPGRGSPGSQGPFPRHRPKDRPERGPLGRHPLQRGPVPPLWSWPLRQHPLGRLIGLGLDAWRLWFLLQGGSGVGWTHTHCNSLGTGEIWGPKQGAPACNGNQAINVGGLPAITSSTTEVWNGKRHTPGHTFGYVNDWWKRGVGADPWPSIAPDIFTWPLEIPLHYEKPEFELPPELVPSVDPELLPITQPVPTPAPLPYPAIPWRRPNPDRAPGFRPERGPVPLRLPRVGDRPREVSLTPRGAVPLAPVGRNNRLRGRERKFIANVPAASALGRIVNGITEAVDAIEAFHEALPPWARNAYTRVPGTAGGRGIAKPPPHEMLRDIVEAVPQMDMSDFDEWMEKSLINLAKNELVDRAFGRAGRALGRASRRFDRPVGLATGPAI